MQYKNYKLEGDGTFGYTMIKPVGKGSVPVPLRGRYTSSLPAQNAIDRYLDSQAEKKDGNTKGSSRD